MSERWFPADEPGLFDVVTRAPGPPGRLPLTPADLVRRPSGDLFGWTQDVGMGLPAAELGRPEVLILSTNGGVRAPDGSPVALGYHTGHWEVGLLVEEAARALRQDGCIPFAGFCTDPCDGRTQGTTGMFDSLPYRNDAALVLRRLIRSLPTRQGVIGVATCDKGLPAMMLALAGAPPLPVVLVPGGVTLPASDGEDAGKVQTIGARFAHGQLSLEAAAELGCRACGSPGGGCQFLGTAATSQVVAEALGLAVPHSALAPSGQPLWKEAARRSVAALAQQRARGLGNRQIIGEKSLKNAMAVFAAVGGSTNLLLHLPALAHAAGLPVPGVDEWAAINKRVPRLVDCLPNGEHPTVRVFLAGGVPEVMLHLRALGLLELDALTAQGAPLGDALDAWEKSERRMALRERLRSQDGVDPEQVIFNPERAAQAGLRSTITFVSGNLAPGGAVVKSTAIDPSALDDQGVYRLLGRARVFTTERAAIAAIKTQGPGGIESGDVVILCCRGPLGAGMEESYQVTAALKYLPQARHVPLLTDARFSGVSTGPCIGHISPEALSGGPLGKLQDGDRVRVEIDTVALRGSIDLVTPAAADPSGFAPDAAELARRAPRADLAPDPDLPDDTRLWAALQNVSGGAWQGAVYDVPKILAVLEAGQRALAKSRSSD
ncbi:MAG TPA: YjhG/YagF family D-xylonate dehydratase [Polyangiaceae bacterium]|nr:YjhG/YagF family D-xylonate dehydratase [Polyangiaceae bacterium]